MEPAKLIIEVDGGDGLDATPSETPQPPGARPETPRSPPVLPPPRPEPPEPAFSFEDQKAAILNSLGKSFKLDISNRRAEQFEERREERIQPPPPPRPAEPSPPPAPAAAASPPPQDPDEWYPRYRELQNRLDMGGELKAEEVAELRRLTEALMNFKDSLDSAGAPAPPPPVAPPPSPPSPPRPQESEPAPKPQPPAPPLPAPPPAPQPRQQSQESEPAPKPPAPPPPAPLPPAPPPLPPRPRESDEATPRPKPPMPPRPADDGETYDVEDEPPRLPPPPKPRDDTYGFKRPRGRPVHEDEDEEPPIPLVDDTYNVAPPPPKPSKPPGTPRPRAEVISDHEKSREQWEGSGPLDDLKGYLPLGIGSKFGGKFKAMGSAYTAASTEAAAAGAGRAGAMAAGVGEAALAAGPAAVVAAMALAGKAYEATLHHLGDRAAQLAANDNAGILEDGAKAARLGLIAIGPAGAGAAAALTLATPVVKEFSKVAHAFVERGQYLAKYNSDLGAAQARSNVRTTLADVREADALSPSISRTTENVNQMDVGIRDLLLPIKQGISELVAGTTDVGKEIVTLLKAFAPVIKFVVQVGTAVPTATLKIFAEVIAMFRKALEKWPFNVKFDDEMKDGDLNSMLNDFLKASDRIAGPFAPGNRPMPAVAAGGLFGRG